MLAKKVLAPRRSAQRDLRNHVPNLHLDGFDGYFPRLHPLVQKLLRTYSLVFRDVVQGPGEREVEGAFVDTRLVSVQEGEGEGLCCAVALFQYG